MALITCPRCGNRITDRALVCPYCEAPDPEQPSQGSAMGRLFWLLVVALTLFIIYVIFYSP